MMILKTSTIETTEDCGMTERTKKVGRRLPGNKNIYELLSLFNQPTRRLLLGALRSGWPLPLASTQARLGRICRG